MFNCCVGTSIRWSRDTHTYPEAGSNKWCVFVQIPFWSAQQETCVTWCLQSPPQHSSFSSTTPSSHLPERGREGEKDHPHWDHSPSIRPFHTLWTWNNQGLIAAVCLCWPWLKPCRLTVQSRLASAVERRSPGMLQRTHKQRRTHTLTYFFSVFIPCDFSHPLFPSFPPILQGSRKDVYSRCFPMSGNGIWRWFWFIKLSLCGFHSAPKL